MSRIKNSTVFKGMVGLVLVVSLLLNVALQNMPAYALNKSIYMSPRNDSSYSMVNETEVILGLMASDSAGIQQASNQTVISGVMDEFKDKITINGMKLSTAMSQDSGVRLECPSWANGLLRVRITFKNGDGTAHTNPFGITAVSSWVKFDLAQGITVNNCTVEATSAYYSLITKEWSATQPADLPPSTDTSTEPIMPRNDAALMCKIDKGDKFYYQLWLKAKGSISSTSSLESLISINGITVEDAKMLATETDSIVFNVTNDSDRKNFFIYIQCLITEDDEPLNAFGITGKEDIVMVLAKGMSIGTDGEVPASKWNYTVADNKWVKDETYVAPNAASYSHNKNNTKIIKDGSDYYYQVALTSSVKLTTKKTDLLADPNLSDAAKQVMLNNLIINDLTVGRRIHPGDTDSGLRLIANGTELDIQFKVEATSTKAATKPLNVLNVMGPDNLKVALNKGFIANGIPSKISVFTYVNKTWKKTVALDPRAIITKVTCEISKSNPNDPNDTTDKQYFNVNFLTNKSVIENGGASNFQAADNTVSKNFIKNIYFNGISIEECFKLHNNNMYLCRTQCTQSGIHFSLDKDRRQDSGAYDNINNYFGVDYNTDFVFEVKDGVVLNGNAIEPCRWLYHGDTHTFTEMFEEYENPETVQIVGYNNMYNEGIVTRSTGYQYVIRLRLDKVVMGGKYLVANKTKKDREVDPAGYELSQNIREHLYVDGMNLDFWSGYRNSSMNIVDVLLMGGVIELRPFEDYMPAMHPDDVHWLEITEGFTTLKGVKVKPIKLFYDPEKRYWEEVDSFDSVKKPAILVKRETVEYQGPTGQISNPSWLKIDPSIPPAVVEPPKK